MTSVENYRDLGELPISEIMLVQAIGRNIAHLQTTDEPVQRSYHGLSDISLNVGESHSGKSVDFRYVTGWDKSVNLQLAATWDEIEGSNETRILSARRTISNHVAILGVPGVPLERTETYVSSRLKNANDLNLLSVLRTVRKIKHFQLGR